MGSCRVPSSRDSPRPCDFWGLFAMSAWWWHKWSPFINAFESSETIRGWLERRVSKQLNELTRRGGWCEWRSHSSSPGHRLYRASLGRKTFYYHPGSRVMEICWLSCIWTTRIVNGQAVHIAIFSSPSPWKKGLRGTCASGRRLLKCFTVWRPTRIQRLLPYYTKLPPPGPPGSHFPRVQ